MKEICKYEIYLCVYIHYSSIILNADSYDYWLLTRNRLKIKTTDTMEMIRTEIKSVLI